MFLFHLNAQFLIFFFKKKKMFSQCAVSVAAFALSSIKDGLQKRGEGCDGRLVQASQSDASRFEYWTKFLQRMFSVRGGRGMALHTFALQVCHCVGRASTGEACFAHGATSQIKTKAEAEGLTVLDTV